METAKERVFEVKGNEVIITFNPNSQEVSKSGKSFMLASSVGFSNVPDGDGGEIGVSYNIIRKKI